MDSDGVLAEITAASFKAIIGGFLDLVIAKNEKLLT